MTWMDILRTAFHALRGNWMRSALTSLGVISGIAAVIVMVSVGQGTQKEGFWQRLLGRDRAPEPAPAAQPQPQPSPTPGP